MKTQFLLALTILVLVSACGSSSSSGRSTYMDPHAEAHQQLHNELVQEELQKAYQNSIELFTGTYTGSFPCKDCDGIAYTLTLKKDMSYRSEILYKGKSLKTEVQESYFNFMENDIIALNDALESMSFFKIEGDQLRLLDKNRKPVTAGPSEAYILKPVDNGPKNEALADTTEVRSLNKKRKDGIVFMASNENKSWTLKYFSNDSLKLVMKQGRSFTAKLSKPLPTLQPEILDYRVKNKEGEIFVHLVEEKCSLNDSDQVQNFQVNVKLDLKADKNTYDLIGCGSFVPDPNLDGSWHITWAMDSPINKEQFEGRQPFIKIDTEQGRISGNEGCNGFQGQIKFKAEEMVIGPLAGTLMACPNMDISSKITGAIGGNTLSYVFDRDELIFYKGVNKVMVLTPMPE
ncbi:copper resistance protein NlpE N-terminal domain-containing protein [Lutimonas zeaxanthinifaciens]|uniref:copper resistance protein NlpE N-terminal domain-containing protein n=1 Tax=Lutimonas zeaxanthinifaciens TaxID=3060215 RepID=UPI00265D18A9|nr:copper resistance protein NlpE N-terminal domain-containing protein [Lutimonas sp. YSD2104]WKK64751.1 copper resistance protein NlpE N-terminal domain-containing protein [Lutimonas sp. YSD2104]